MQELANINTSLTLDRIVFNPDIRSIAHYYRCGEGTFCKKQVIKQIALLASRVNVVRNITEAQIYFTADLIVEKYFQLSIEDLELCFKNALMGKYGKVYDRLDTPIICEWLTVYKEERMEFAEKKQLSTHKIHVNFDIDEMSAMRLREAIKPVEVEEKNILPKTKIDLFGQRCIAQFDRLFKKYGKDFGGSKFVSIGKLNLTVQEFVEYKFRKLT